MVQQRGRCLDLDLSLNKQIEIALISLSFELVLQDKIIFSVKMTF